MVKRKRKSRRQAKVTPPAKPKLDAAGNPIIPRLGPNGGYLGPEYYGCCGTGRRPLILHCKYSRRYIVGAELDVSVEMRSKIMATPNKRLFRNGKSEVWAFKGRTAAVAKFHELCGEVKAYNAGQRAAHERDRAAATQARIQAGDTNAMAALLRLGTDY